LNSGTDVSVFSSTNTTAMNFAAYSGTLRIGLSATNGTIFLGNSTSTISITGPIILGTTCSINCNVGTEDLKICNSFAKNIFLGCDSTFTSNQYLTNIYIGSNYKIQPANTVLQTTTEIKGNCILPITSTIP